MVSKKVDLPIKGMASASYAQRIEKALKKTEGVQEAHVNLATAKGVDNFPS